MTLRSDLTIPLPLDLFVDYDDALGVDCDQGAADVGVFHVPFKCQVVRAQLAVTEVCAGSSTTPVVDFDKRPTLGSDGSRGAADIAHFIMGTTAQGKVLYDEVAVGTVLEPGEEVVVQLTTAATGTPTGHFRPELLVQQMPETKANMTDLVATT